MREDRTAGRRRSAVGRAAQAATVVWMLVLSACGIEPPDPGAFYQIAPDSLAGPPGEVLRIEPLAGAPGGGNAYRVLYRSTGLDSRPIAVSGVIVVPPGPVPPGGRPVIAWAHPTTGVATRCAPSLRPQVFQQIQGLEAMLAQGFVVAATDYPGLGTTGAHPYLVGISEGRAVLDSVRAANRLAQAGASRRFAVWGHSQGGQAVLFAGELAASYAPELTLAGVAAAAPATDLARLLEDDVASVGGKVLTSFALWSWNKVYGAPLGTVLDPGARPVVDGIAADCIETALEDVVVADLEQALQRRFLVADVTRIEPWRTLLAENSPGKSPAGAPVFIVQGSADKVVRPQVTQQFARGLCARGTPVVFEWLKGAGHDPAGKLGAPAAVAWMADRLAGKPVPDQCRALPAMPH